MEDPAIYANLLEPFKAAYEAELRREAEAAAKKAAEAKAKAEQKDKSGSNGPTDPMKQR